MFDRFGDLIGGAFSLSQDAFQRIIDLPEGQTTALFVVLSAGLSLGVGQSLILFVNRVRPLRFVFSLLLNAVLFTCGFLFLVFSTWAIGWLPGLVHIPWNDLVEALGLSYAPLQFSFLTALPYAGVPIHNLLSVWHLLAMVVGFSAISQVSGSSAFVHVAFGWFMLQFLKGTIGQPIAKLGRRLTKRVAGVELANRPAELTAIVQSDLDRFASVGFDRELQNSEADLIQDTLTPTVIPTDNSPLGVHLPRRQGIPRRIRLGLIFLGTIVLFAMLAILLRPIRQSLFGWYEDLPRLARRTFDLSWIGVVALIFAGLLAPLETLGWWAGWYGDDPDISPQRVALESVSSNALPSRYVVYVDGVGQSKEEYTPDVVEFVRSLQAVLPQDVEFLQGLMFYSVLNRPLDRDRPLSWIWRLADRMRWQNPTSLMGFMVNLRNAWIVAVSADKRYGPLYNQGIAEVLCRGLLERGYQPGSGIPITAIGYSGGAQMSVAMAPYLKRVLGADIEVISLGGVMSANNNFLKLEHLYHLVGDKDGVARLGPILFPGRRKWFPLSYWNRAMRKGKISQISLGPMGHQVPGGIMDPDALLPNGKSHLQHTIATIIAILQGSFLVPTSHRPRQISNYQNYKQADFNDYSYYPLSQTVDEQWYRPISPWMGRPILPKSGERRQVRGIWFEVHHTPDNYKYLVGQTVMLRWLDRPAIKELVRAVTHDVHFSVDAEYSSSYSGNIHPERLNHWQKVDPLESLAGSHPTDDIMVMLTGEVEVEESETANYPVLRIAHQPVEITGRYYALVQFISSIPNSDRFQVRHFNPISRQFDGQTEVVRLPQVIPSEIYGSYPSTNSHLAQNPLNETGWYIYGAKDAGGYFVVRSLAPRSLLRLQPDRVVFGSKAAYRYIRQESWAEAAAQKGKISSVLCVGKPDTESIQAAIDDWQEGDRALLLHVYGGIGGHKKEPAAATPIFFGHFAYGLATVIRDPLSNELQFEIQYYQVYTHNTDGLTAGVIHWSRYIGDRQFGWLGTRPVCDILIKFEPFTGEFNINGRRSPLDNMLKQLEAMTARYRIGDGTGGTYVGPANNCSQDSNQALFASIRSVSNAIAANQPLLETWLAENPSQAPRYRQLLNLKDKLSRKLQPLGSPRTDWEANEFNLGTTLEDEPLRNLWIGLGSWRTLLPRKASDTIASVFLEQGASVWVLRTNQIGGQDPDIEPIAPMTL
jgi:predicted Abi (CAAX) family protease